MIKLIVSVNENNFEKAKAFVEKAGGNVVIENSILKKASLIINDDIDGIISYEKFANVGLIRYFIFRRNIKDEDAFSLIENISKKAKEEDINLFLSITKNETIKNILLVLGFYSLNNNDVYLGEVNINKTEFKDAIILKKDI